MFYLLLKINFWYFFKKKVFDGKKSLLRSTGSHHSRKAPTGNEFIHPLNKSRIKVFSEPSLQREAVAWACRGPSWKSIWPIMTILCTISWRVSLSLCYVGGSHWSESLGV